MAPRTLNGEPLKTTALPPFQPVSRAVKRPINPGAMTACKACDDPLKFVAARKLYQIICNVYEDKVWQAVEHYHPACYERLGKPYGEILSTVAIPSAPQAGRGSTSAVG